MGLDQKSREVDELEERISLLEEKKGKLEDQAREFGDKRDKLNGKVKNARTEVEQLRKERDEINEKVRESKQHRNESTSKIRETIDEIRKLSEKSRIIAKKRPSRDHESLQEEVESIDWEIQTTPHTLEEDKQLVERVRELENQLNVHKRYEKLGKMIRTLRAEVERFKRESTGYHEALTANAEKSQELHGKMLAKVEEWKKLRAEADEFHRKFVLAKESIKPLQDEITVAVCEIRKLKGEMRKGEAEEKKQTEDHLRESIENRAREKLKRGEKLSWEEFQLLAEKGISTQD